MTLRLQAEGRAPGTLTVFAGARATVNVPARPTLLQWMALSVSVFVAGCGGGATPISPSTGSDGAYKVSGTVTSSNGVAINGATVVIRKSSEMS